MIEVKHYSNGNIKSVNFKNEEGEWHNLKGPALQEWYETGQEEYKAYYVDGKRHNPNGLAYQEWYKNGTAGCRAYFINGKEITEKDFLARQNTVEVTVEGKTTRISRESAKTLNLIKE